MNATANTLLESVLALPEADRITIVEALLESITDEQPEYDDAELCQELKRRSEEARSDPSATISWEDLRKMS